MLIKTVAMTSVRRLKITLEETVWHDLDELKKSLGPGEAIDLESEVADFIRTEVRTLKAKRKSKPQPEPITT